jgi:O-antigen/teichoic acid export membrane protein
MPLSLLKLINVFLRIGGVGSKFIILTLMSKYFDVDVFGNYGLITSLITILIFALGLDFYNFSIRDILKTKNEQEVVDKTISSLLLYVIIYIVFSFIAYLVLDTISYVKPFVFLVIGLSITEHLSQEIYRLLIGFKNVLFANILLFIRTMGWSIIIIFYYFNNILITIDSILSLWLAFNLLTIIIVLLYSLFKNFHKILKGKFIVSWIKKGLRISMVFLVATISLKLMEYANRFIVDFFMGEKMAGIFLFYSNISMLITVYINTVVISFELPELISSTNSPTIFKLLKKFKKSLFTHVVISSVFLLIIIKPLLFWQNKTEFETYLPLIFFMLLGTGLMNYSLIYHFKLYIFHKDKSLLKVMVISAFFSLILTIILTSIFGVYGTASAFLISCILLFFMRLNEAKKMSYD